MPKQRIATILVDIVEDLHLLARDQMPAGVTRSDVVGVLATNCHILGSWARLDARDPAKIPTRDEIVRLLTTTTKGTP